jgi:hypothetical protein
MFSADGGVAMDRHEEAVMHCLTANGETFLAHEPDLGRGWSRPDFVAIRPPKKRAYIIEVTDSGKPAELVEKVNAREKQWLNFLRAHLESLDIANKTWSYGVLVFARRDQRDWLKSHINDMTDVTILCLEEAASDWEWPDHIWTSNFSFETDVLKRATR